MQQIDHCVALIRKRMSFQRASKETRDETYHNSLVFMTWIHSICLSWTWVFSFTFSPSNIFGKTRSLEFRHIVIRNPLQNPLAEMGFGMSAIDFCHYALEFYRKDHVEYLREHLLITRHPRSCQVIEKFYSRSTRQKRNPSMKLL